MAQKASGSLTITNITDGANANIWTTSTAPTTPNYTFTISNLTGADDNPRVGDIILQGVYRYTITSIGSTTVLAGSRQSLQGATGAAGGKWYSGTGITGTNTTAQVFSGSGVSSAVVGDMYLNTSTDNVYQCTTAGNASTAKWKYVGNIKGSTGSQGRSVTSVVTEYYRKLSGGSAPTSSTTGSTTIPDYVDGCTYYTRTITNFDSGNPDKSEWVANSGLTNEIKNAYDAWIAAGAAELKVAKIIQNSEGMIVTSGINGGNVTPGTTSTYGYNTLMAPNYLGLRYNAINLAKLTTTESTPALEFYIPSVNSGGTPVQGNKGLSISATALTFYNPSSNAAQLIIGANGTLQSGNYTRGSDSKFSSNGTKIDLINGDIITKYFRVSQGLESGLNAGVYVHGTIEALDGTIGTDSTNYWEIGNSIDYNLNSTAKMVGHGSSYIQLGDSSTWRLSTNRIHTAWYTSGDSLLHFPAISSKYWDFGVHTPDSATDKFLYIRSSKSNTSTSSILQNLLYDIDDSYATPQWDYKFYIDGSGNLYAANLYFFDENGNAVQVGGADGAYLPKTGGTITGNLEVNGTLTKSGKNVAYLTTTPTSGQILIADGTSGGIKTSGYTIAKSVPSNAIFTDENVKSTEANTTKLWLVGSDTSGTRTGTLKYDSGVYITTTAGTIHATTFEGNLSGTASRATADADGNTIKTTYLKLSGGNVTGAVTFGSSVSVDELTVGDLVVNGSASFTNNAQFNTINGVAVGSSPKFTDTTYSSLSAASGGTAVSLVTTGEKYTWNNKQDKLTNPVTGTGTNGYLTKWTGTNTIGNGPALGTDTTKFLNNKGEWAVPPGGVTGVKGNSESSYRTGQVNLTAANIGLGNVENKSSATIRGELTASNVTTALGYTPNHNVSLGFHNDYERCVIALCKTSATNTGINSWSNGVLLRQRDNGLVPTKVAYVTFNGCYGTAYSAHYSLICNHENTSVDAHGSTEGFRACTFTYNNERYAGLEFYQVQASTFFYTQFGGTFTPFMIQYYNTNSNTVKNSEIDNSLVYGTNTLFRQSFDAQTITGHTVAKNVPSDAIFTDTWKALSTSQAGYVSQAPNDTSKFLRGDAQWAAVTKSNVGLGNVTNDKQIKGLSSGTTSGHLVTWGSDGYTVADSGITKSNIVKSVGSNNNGQLVLTYADDTTSNPIDVTFVATIASSATLADALNVNGTAVGSATVPVYFDNQGKPQTANTIPKLNNATTGGTFYAPTAGGTADTQALVGNGVTTAPKWVNISPSISITAGTSSATPKINVTVLGRSGTAQSLTTASTSVYGATKLSSTSSSTEQGLAATPKLVYDSIAALDGNLNNTTPGAGKTLTAFSQTDGKISATFSNISITKSQISDFPTSMTPAAHTHDDRYYTETEVDNKFTALTNTTTQINYIKFYAGNCSAGKTYIGWIKIASIPMNTSNHLGENCYDFGIYRGYNSPASESYNIRINTGWGNASIVQLNGKAGEQIIEKFRFVKDNTNHICYFEIYVNTSYTTYENNVNLRVQKWTGSNEVTLLNTVQTEADSAFEIVSTLDLKPQGIVSNSNFYGNLVGNADTASTASAVAWNNITSKPINLKAYSGSLASGGWSQLNGKANSPTIAIAYNSGAASWNSGTYSASMVFGCQDTRGLLDLAYNTPIVTFGGASYGGATDDNPKWYFKLSGTSEQTYTFPSTSKTLAATDGSNASGTWGISISGNAATASSATKATQDGSGNTITTTYVQKAGDSMSGGLAINASNSYSSYNEGLRINAGARTYATLLMGGTNGTTSGVNDGAFWIGVYNTGSYARRLMIAHNGSTATNTYFYSNASGTVSPWLHLGNSGTITSGNADAVTGGVVYTAISNLSGTYVSLNGNEGILGTKVFGSGTSYGSVTSKTSYTAKANINYNSTLDALVFSFA